MRSIPATVPIPAGMRRVAEIVIPCPVVPFISRCFAPDQTAARPVWGLYVVWMAAHRCPGT